ncbi:SEC-C domain-containing protein [Adlercreutzia equolifaciens]|uniref:SEC-C domain-containing protein n=1 Tax=Adlercreutzia equolifaciens TaxID=446660 RepID=UPI0022DF392E|nr:SEC-C domain-containing protein [Adlercreutzia equolifaciens]
MSRSNAQTETKLSSIDFEPKDPSHHEELKSKLPELEREINQSIESIWDKISRADPKALLMCSSDIERIGHFQSFGDAAIAMPNDFPSRPTEYIQSVIASSKAFRDTELNKEMADSLCMEIISDIEELAMKMQLFILCWACGLEKSVKDEKDRELIVEAQEMYLVRGNRYQIFQERFYRPLLNPHNEEFEKLFGLTADEVTTGLMTLENALSQGRFEGLNTLANFFDSFDDGRPPDPDDLLPDQADILSSAVFETFSVEHFDVSRITEWPEKFIEKLSFDPGDAQWFDQGRYKNWPIVSLPVRRKPFIRLNGNSYCFDYYTLMDNFYRVIRETLIECDADYEQIWQIKQKEASEKFVAEIFSNLLPGCTCYASNYFSPTNKKGSLVENDLIVRYHDSIIIVEVKAGSFTYAPPLTDWNNHVRDYKSLIEKADHQCSRVHEYLCKHEQKAPLLDARGITKAEIDMSAITDIFEISVTIDDINAFASKAERLNFLNLKSGAISISINDLMVYEDYFDNPFEFLHFLSQRRNASRNKRLAFNDELDHLGMYIENNYYSLDQPEDEAYDTIYVIDSRDDLNAYYNNGRKHGIDIPKPRQKLPEFYNALFRSQSVIKMSNPVHCTSYLLNFSSETRAAFSGQVQMLISRAQVRGCSQILNLTGSARDSQSVRMSCFVGVDNANQIENVKESREYVFSIMLANNEMDRTLLIFSFNKNGTLDDVHFELLRPQDVDPVEAKRLLNMGLQHTQRFVENHIKVNGKIGRNELCPCGSGLKYKKCHGR